jgi:hypothetical protein
MGSANECDQFTRKRESHKPENDTMTKQEGKYMEMLANRRTQGARRSLDRNRMHIINSTVTPLPIVYCSTGFEGGLQTTKPSEFIRLTGEIVTVSLFIASMVFSLYMIHGLVTGGVAW